MRSYVEEQLGSTTAPSKKCDPATKAGVVRAAALRCGTAIARPFEHAFRLTGFY